MQVFQTAGAPPNFGRIILAIMGWTENSRAALTNSVTVNHSRTGVTSGSEEPVPDHPRDRRLRPPKPLALLTVAAVLLVSLFVATMPWRGMFPDVICYWAAGKVLASGHSPYDVQLQTDVQRAYGW